MTNNNNGRNSVSISNRMLALTRQVTAGNSVVDVGCDHGLVSIYLVQQGICPKALAMDVRKGPLSSAASHIREQGLEAVITTRLSDGLKAYQIGEADTCIIAGMGGPLMADILSADMEKTRSFKELILQPQSELKEFRVFLRDNGLRVVDEDMLKEEGKYYWLMKVVPSDADINLKGTDGENTVGENAGSKDTDGRDAEDRIAEVYDSFGELPVVNRNPVLVEYLQGRLNALSEIAQGLQGASTDKALARLEEIRVELRIVERALELMQE